MPTFVGSYWFLSLCVFISVVLAITGLLVVRRFVSHEDLMTHHEVAGYFLSIVGTLYAVVLGFIVVNALNTFDKARVNVEHEANALHDVFHLSLGLPQAASSHVRQLCMQYSDCMVNDEWKSMERGEPSAQAHQIMANMLKIIV